MKDLSLADLLRYLSAGAMALILYYIADPVAAGSRFELLTEVSTLLVTLMLGTVIYWVYRAFVYNRILSPLQDLFARQNYRTHLVKTCKVTPPQAERIFLDLRDTHLMSRYANLGIWASGIHQLYMGFTLTLVFSILRAFAQDWPKAFWLLVISAILLWAGMLNDASYERRELTLLLSLDSKVIEEACDREKRANTPQPPSTSLGS